MSATTPRTLSGATFLANTPTSATVYTDGDLYYVVMDYQTRMKVILREKDEYFTTFVDREGRKQGLEVVINGNYYDVSYWGMAWAVADTADPGSVTPEGYLVESGVRLDGKSRPNHFYVAQNPGASGWSNGWKFGFGDPPITGTRSAVGGVGPLLIGGLKYGDGNLYKQGASAGAPKTGDPGANSQYLVQRNNENFKDFHNQGPRRGKTVIAYASKAEKLIILVQPEGAATGISLADLRDKLASVGVDNAVFLDGGNSALLWVNGVWHIKAGDNKNSTNNVGVSFTSPRHRPR